MIFNIKQNESGNQRLGLNVFQNQKGISSDDIVVLKAYNKELANCKNAQVAFDSTMRNASTTAQNMAKNAQGCAVNIDGIQKSSKLSEVALKGFSTALNMAVNFAIIEGLNLIIKLFKNSSDITKELQERAKGLGSSFNSTKDDIKSYQEKISDLYVTINNGNSSIQDSIDARKNLMSIQDELIEKYGSEKNTIDLITQAVSGQTDAWEKLLDVQWQKTKRDFNKSDWWNDFENWQSGYENNIERMKREMGNAGEVVKLSGTDYFSGEYKDAIKLLEDRGWKYDAGSSSFFGNLNGKTTKEVYEDLLEIKDLLGETAPKEFIENLDEQLLENEELIEEYGDIWDQYILYDKILKDNNLSEKWELANDAYSNYQQAVKAGDDEAIQNSIKTFSDLLNPILNNSKIDNSIKKYFEDLYPALTRETEKLEFKTNIIPTLDTSKLKSKNKNDILKDIFDVREKEVTSSFDEILSKANEYGIITGNNSERVAQLLDLLEQWGIIQSTINEESNKENISSDEKLLKKWNSKGFDETRQKLKSLAMSGEFSPEVLKNTEEYKKLIDELGMSADTAFKKIQQLSLEDVNTDIDDYTELLEKIRNNQVLSGEEAAKFIEKNSSLAGSLKEVGNGYSFEEDAIVDLLNTSIKGKNVIISSQIEQTKSTIKNINSRIKSYNKELEALIKTAREMATAASVVNDISASTGYYLPADAFKGGDVNKINDSIKAYEKRIKKLKKRAKKNDKKLQALEKELEGLNTSASSGSGSSGSSSSSKSNTKQEFDWIERKVTSLTNKISLLNAQKENLFTVKDKNKNLNKQIKETTKLINTYKAAVSKYEAKANSVKISKTKKTDKALKKKVRNGQIKGTYSQLVKEYGETTANRIQKYQEYYDKSRSAKQSLSEAKTSKHNLKVEGLQIYADYYDGLVNKFKELASNTALSYSKRNSYINDEIKNLKNSYDYQIKIANANKDSAEATRLQAEREREIVALKKEQFDNVKLNYDREVQRNNWNMNALDRAISEIEGRGQNVNRAYYDREKAIEASNLATYRSQLPALQAALKNIPAYTDEWYDAQDEINTCLDNISESIKKGYELTDKIHELYYNLFENIREQIKRVDAEQEFLRGLFAHEESFDSDTGAITEAGIARLGSFATSYYIDKINADKDKEYLDSLISMRDNGTWQDQFNSLEKLEDEIDSVYTTWQNDIKETYSVENDIFNMMKENYQAQLDALKKLIEKRKESLSLEKEIHDYQRQIREKTTAITDTQRQITAYRGDTSSEGMARMQRLQKQLADQQDDLREAEYDRSISDQQNMLDKLLSEFEETITGVLKDFKDVVSRGLEIGNANSGTANGYLATIAANSGYNQQYPNASGSNGANETANGITSNETSQSGTPNTPPPQPASVPVAPKTAPAWNPIVHTEGGRNYNLNDANDAKDFIKWFGDRYSQTTKTAYGKLSEFNQSYIKYTGGKVGTGGKVSGGKILSVSDQKLLASYFGLTYDNSNKTGALFKKLHSLGIKGFSHGGIVKVDDIARQVRANGDDGIASVKNGEGILTPVETKAFLTLADNLDAMNLATDLMKNYSSIPNVLDNLSNYGNNNSVNEVNYGGVNFNFDVHGNNPSEMIRAIQNNPQLQKAIEKVSVGRLTNNNRLGVRSIK